VNDNSWTFWDVSRGSAELLRRRRLVSPGDGFTQSRGLTLSSRHCAVLRDLSKFGNSWSANGVNLGVRSSTFSIFILLALHSITMAQTPQTPNVEAQRAAMKKLSFLIGEWSGEASAARGPGVVVKLSQTETAEFKLDGLVLAIEGVGRAKSDGKLALQALGLITFDDSTGTYHMRAYNDGRWLETEVKLLDDGKSLSWGFTFGEMSTKSVLRINEEGDWTELAELTIGARPPQKLMELAVRRTSRN
jgi:hypothetical protein